jgi:hypothetical protein
VPLLYEGAEYGRKKGVARLFYVIEEERNVEQLFKIFGVCGGMRADILGADQFFDATGHRAVWVGFCDRRIEIEEEVRALDASVEKASVELRKDVCVYVRDCLHVLHCEDDAVKRGDGDSGGQGRGLVRGVY